MKKNKELAKKLRELADLAEENKIDNAIMFLTINDKVDSVGVVTNMEKMINAIATAISHDSDLSAIFGTATLFAAAG